MPELDIERRQGVGFPWWAWLIGVLVVGLVIWGIVEATTPERPIGNIGMAPSDRVAGERQETVTPDNTGATEGTLLPLSGILGAPNNYFGQQVSGMATVGDVISDRGFWIEDNGNRMLVVLDEAIPEQSLDVTTGTRVNITGMVRDAQDTTDPMMGNLDPDSRNALQGQPAFIHANSVTMTTTQEPGQMNNNTPGTTGTMDNSGATPGDTGTTNR